MPSFQAKSSTAAIDALAMADVFDDGSIEKALQVSGHVHTVNLDNAMSDQRGRFVALRSLLYSWLGLELEKFFNKGYLHIYRSSTSFC